VSWGRARVRVTVRVTVMVTVRVRARGRVRVRVRARARVRVSVRHLADSVTAAREQARHVGAPADTAREATHRRCNGNRRCRG
jgi:hypothetical protein